jgi:hypothetical protein
VNTKVTTKEGKAMRKRRSGAKLVFKIVASMVFAGGPQYDAVAHEEHQMKCTETSINAMNSDIQAMDDGEAKTAASKEMEIAKHMMAKKDLKACVTHLHNAMVAIEK